MGTNPVQRPLPDDPNGYYRDLRTAFDVKWTIREFNSTGSTTLCFYPGLASYVLNKDTADATVIFHKEVTMKRGFDGLYVALSLLLSASSSNDRCRLTASVPLPTPPNHDLRMNCTSLCM